MNGMKYTIHTGEYADEVITYLEKPAVLWGDISHTHPTQLDGFSLFSIWMPFSSSQTQWRLLKSYLMTNNS